MLSASNDAPQYRKIGEPDIDGNPLTAHLPLGPETDTEAFLALAMKPEFSERERSLPRTIRRLRIKRLRRFHLPFMKEHRRALTGICSNLIDGYAARNPLTPLGQRILNGCQVDLPFAPVISLLTGCSGMGKSTLMNRILSYIGGQVWRHTSFEGQPFTETQITYLRRNVPERCNVAALCDVFGDYTDSVLGLRLYSGIFAKIGGKGSRNYLREIRRIVSTHHVGLLVLDELQNLSLMGVGAKSVLAFLVNLRDELGLPIVGIGTYKALKLIEGDASAGRRFVEGGFYDLQRPKSYDSEEWQALCSTAWEYQWVREPVEYSTTIARALYEVSQGIPAVMLSAFAAAQLTAIDDGTEKVDAELIGRVFREQMGPLHPAIRALQSGNPILMDKFESLYHDYWPSLAAGETGDEDHRHEAPPGEVALSSGSEAPTGAAGDVTKTVQAGSATSAGRAKLAPPALTEEQTRKMVLAQSTQDLLGILERR